VQGPALKDAIADGILFFARAPGLTLINALIPFFD
jgi:hypothetical protein